MNAVENFLLQQQSVGDDSIIKTTNRHTVISLIAVSHAPCICYNCFNEHLSPTHFYTYVLSSVPMEN